QLVLNPDGFFQTSQCYFDSITNLDLSDHGLYSLNPVVSLFSKLMKLDLGDNLLNEVRDNVTAMPSLRYLYLDNNNLTFISKNWPLRFAELTVYAYGNPITSLDWSRGSDIVAISNLSSVVD